jgi:hypothetical protein
MRANKFTGHSKTNNLRTKSKITGLKTEIKELKNMLGKTFVTRPSRKNRKSDTKRVTWPKFSEFSSRNPIKSTLSINKESTGVCKQDTQTTNSPIKAMRNQSEAVIPRHKPFFNKLSPIV